MDSYARVFSSIRGPCYIHLSDLQKPLNDFNFLLSSLHSMHRHFKIFQNFSKFWIKTILKFHTALYTWPLIACLCFSLWISNSILFNPHRSPISRLFPLNMFCLFVFSFVYSFVYLFVCLFVYLFVFGGVFFGGGSSRRTAGNIKLISSLPLFDLLLRLC